MGGAYSRNTVAVEKLRLLEESSGSISSEKRKKKGDTTMLSVSAPKLFFFNKTKQEISYKMKRSYVLKKENLSNLASVTLLEFHGA